MLKRHRENVCESTVLQERAHFGFKIFNVFSELKQTWVISLVFSILISGLTLGAGMVFTHETILILSIVIIFLSITFSLSMLSASYTIGITYMIVLLTFIIFGSRTSPKSDVLTNVNFTEIGRASCRERVFLEVYSLV